MPVEINSDMEEIKPSPVGTPPKAKAKITNKDGLIKGQIVEEKDYWAIVNKSRKK